MFKKTKAKTEKPTKKNSYYQNLLEVERSMEVNIRDFS